MEKSAAKSKPLSSEGKTIFKNMVITVLTTVIGATVVYFLGFNNKKPGLTKLEREEVTVEAWKSYVAVENLYTKNAISLMRDVAKFGSFKGMYQENKKESERFQSSLTGLIATDGVDNDLKDVLKRRLDNEVKQIGEGEVFYKDMDSLIQHGVDAGWSSKQVNDSAQAKLLDYGERSKGPMERAVADIEVLSKTLSERYDQPFSMDEFIIIQVLKYKKDPLSFLEEGLLSQPDPNKPTNPGVKASSTEEATELNREYLVGKWQAGGEATISFGADGKLNWLAKPGGDEAAGSWKIADGQIIMTVQNPKTKKYVTWHFNLGPTLKNSFTMMLSKEPFNTYNLVRL